MLSLTEGLLLPIVSPTVVFRVLDFRRSHEFYFVKYRNIDHWIKKCMVKTIIRQQMIQIDSHVSYYKSILLKTKEQQLQLWATFNSIKLYAKKSQSGEALIPTEKLSSFQQTYAMCGKSNRSVLYRITAQFARKFWKEKKDNKRQGKRKNLIQ